MKYRYIFNHRERYKFLILIKRNDKSSLPILELLKDYDINDYYIIKQTANFRFICEEDLGKYAGVVLLRKDIYKKDDIQRWFNFIKEMNINLLFLNKPLPDVKLLEKIKIVDEI
jgi:hypothetical protein